MDGHQQQPGWPPTQPPNGGGWVWMPGPAAGTSSPPPPAPAPPIPPQASIPPPPARPPADLARWESRAYGTLIDIAIGAGLITAYSLTLTLVSPVVHVLVWITGLFGGDYNSFVRFGTWGLSAAFWGWQWIERGKSGQSIGQRLIGVRVVDAESLQPIGPARSVIRSLTHIVDILPIWIGYARPVWEPSRQTWADKIHKTIAVNANKETANGN